MGGVGVDFLYCDCFVCWFGGYDVVCVDCVVGDCGVSGCWCSCGDYCVVDCCVYCGELLWIVVGYCDWCDWVC